MRAEVGATLAVRGRRQAGAARVGQASVLALTWGVTAAVLVGCAPRAPALNGGAAVVGTKTFVSSNVLRQDYAGSAACGACHGDVVSAWERSPMHRMTRLPESAEIRAPFDGREFRFKGDVARFEQVNGSRFVRLSPRDQPPRLYRVTKVIGGRYREDFAGIEVASAEPGAAAVADPHDELVLPVSFVFENASFRLKGYSVLVGERPGLRAGGVWNQTCIFCHNTIPYFDDLWGALHGPGAPSYQGEVVDRALPRARQVRYGVTDAQALLKALDAEVALLVGGAVPERTAAAGAGRPGARTGDDDDDGDRDGGDLGAQTRVALRRAMAISRVRFGPEHFIELGIGCESCHGGSREHADDPRRHPSFQPRAAFLSVDAGGDREAPISAAEWQNRACARCHQVLFSRYAHTWEGGLRRSPEGAGGSSITSGEARDFLLGGCARAMTCTSCHDPHGADGRVSLARLETAAGNRVCTGCHAVYSTPAALRAHAHHDPTGAGGSCVACHMPRKNMGLGYALTRYHRIGSPTDKLRVERDRPLECALCHADRTVGFLAATMEQWWGKRYDQEALRQLYGSLGANVLVATIERGHAHEQAAAMGSAGQQRYQPAARAIDRQASSNAYPLVRYYGAVASAALKGKKVPSRFDAEPGDVHGAAGGAPSKSRDDEED